MGLKEQNKTIGKSIQSFVLRLSKDFLVDLPPLNRLTMHELKRLGNRPEG